MKLGSMHELWPGSSRKLAASRPLQSVSGATAVSYRRSSDGADDHDQAPLQTPRPLEGRHGHPGPGGLPARTICALVDHLVRRVLGHAALRHHLGLARLSVLHARRGLGAPSPGIPCGALLVHPVRPQRVEPRVKKRRPQRVPCLIKPRQALRQPLGPQERRRWYREALA
jgi:hypothetical protein